MSETTNCPKCGAQLPPDAPAGLCPQCLVAAGLESEERPEPTNESTTPVQHASAFEPPPVEQLGSLFPQLEILELVGRGGMGAVYKARQRELDRLVAVKILPPEVGQNPAFAERFTREARAMARLSHPNIVAIHDFGQTEGLFYFVMEYVDGANLRQTMHAGAMQPEQALGIVPQMCDALQYAHDEGVVHRDIKPENILLKLTPKKGSDPDCAQHPSGRSGNRGPTPFSGCVKIVDFGLSKLLGREGTDFSLTGTQQVMGTPRYMAPEQMTATRAVDHRADIYSLGVVFYELLTGEVPVGRFAPPSKKVEVDVRLDDVVLKTLESEPERRYQHASDLKTDVGKISSSARFEKSSGTRAVTSRSKVLPSSFKTLPPLAERLDPARRQRLLAASIALLMVGGIVAMKGLSELGALSENGWAEESIYSLARIVVGAVILVAAVLMMSGRNYPFAMTGSVLAVAAGFLLPFSLYSIVVGFGVGLWCVLTLRNEGIRSAFDAESEAAPTAVEPEAESRLQGPAAGLFITGLLQIGVGVAMLVSGIWMLVSPEGEQDVGALLTSLGFIGIAVGPIVIHGARKMKRLERRRAAVLASVLAMLPISQASLVGIPVGIWSLVVLRQARRDDDLFV